ncbi:MAG: spore maturation protein [Chitinivibrionia bacterium]|nr:spore maturation protein [Chitinivibrionia bacterium]
MSDNTKKHPAAINAIWFYMIIISILVAAYTGQMKAVGDASFNSAKAAVTLALGLIGGMALWLGIMKVAEAAGLMNAISRGIRPVMRWLFPEIPQDHPAMHAIIMNMAANMLGLGSAATPMGLKAMSELDKLNPNKGTATNAMCLFLAINTSSVTLLPLGVITIRAAAGASNPGSIIIPGLLASICSTAVAITVAKFFAKRYKDEIVSSEIANTEEEKTETPSQNIEKCPPSTFGKIVAWTAIAAFFIAIPYSIINAGGLPNNFLDCVTTSSVWLIPLLIGALLMGGYLCGVSVYETATEGAKEGFQTAVRIIPFLVAIFVAIGMLRASGALELFTSLVGPYTNMVGMPAECVPHALLRPLSGVGAFGYMSEIVNNAPDSLASFVSSIIQGSTDTTLYVLALYFGSVNIRRTRYALTAGLAADAAGITAAVFFANLFFA